MREPQATVGRKGKKLPTFSIGPITSKRSGRGHHSHSLRSNLGRIGGCHAVGNGVETIFGQRRAVCTDGQL